MNEQSDLFNSWCAFVEKMNHDHTNKQSVISSRKITHFLGDKKNQITLLVSALEQIAHNDDAEMLRENINNLNELVHKITALEESMTKPFVLFVMGVGKVGKSTLLNSLVGQNIASVGAIPKTWKTDLFWKSDKQTATVIYRNGQQKNIDQKSAQALVDEEENKREISQEKVDELFAESSGKLNTPDQKRQLKKELEHKHLHRTDIREIHWPLSAVSDKSILHKFSIVDTPGLGQEHAGLQSEDINDFYHQADGILWMLDSTTLSANKPKEILDKLEGVLKKISTDNTDNIICVLNQVDRAIGVDVNQLTSEAKKIYTNKFLDVIPYSAKLAFQGIQTDDHNLLSKSGYTELCTAIDNYFYKHALAKRVNSKATNVNMMINVEYEKYLTYSNRLSDDYNKLKKFGKSTNLELEQLKDSLNQQLDSLLHDYKKNVQQNIESYTEQFLSIDIKNQQDNFLKNNILCLDNFDEKIHAYKKSSLKQISSSRQHLAKKTAFSLYQYIEADSSSRPYDLSIRSDTRGEPNLAFEIAGETIVGGSLIAVAAMVALGPIGLLAGAVFGWFNNKKKKMESTKAELNKHIIKMIDDVEKDTRSFIEKNILESENYLLNIRKTTFAALHCNPKRVESLLDVPKTLEQILATELEKITLIELLQEGV